MEKQKSKSENLSASHMVRLTGWAFSRLDRAYLRFCQEIESNPERWPAYAGRSITYSDVIVLLCQEKEREE